MVYMRKFLFRIPAGVRYVSNSNVTNPSALTTLDFKQKLNNEQQAKILNTLNKSTLDELLQLNLAKSKIKNLEIYKKKKGSFQTLEEILEVDGLGVKNLEKLCEQIISTAPAKELKKSNNNNNNNKKLKQFLAPALPDYMNIESSVGIHLAPTGVSWAKLTTSENHLECWGYENFTNLPKKMLPTDTFTVAYKILSKIPFGDIYVFEGTSNMGLQGQKQASTVASYNNQQELTSMLLALLNTSSKHNPNIIADKTNYDSLNKVFFLRSRLPARLFKTLVGNECVSSTETVSQLIQNPSLEKFTLPCSPIKLDLNLKNEYLSKSAPHKELLGQALLLIIAFTNLCVKKNPVSLASVIPSRK